MKVEGKRWVEGKWIHDPDLKVKIKGWNKVSGVYAIEVEECHRAYIGQSVNIGSRWSQHKHILRKGKCEIKEMQECWDKGYAFNYKILEKSDTDLKIKEKQHAEKYIAAGYELFNGYFLINATSILIERDYMPLFQKIMKLAAKGRLDIKELERHLDNL